MTAYLLAFSALALLTAPPAASAQDGAAPGPPVLCRASRDAIAARYPGVDSSPYSAVRRWAAQRFQQALVSRGCTDVVAANTAAIDVTDDFLARLDADKAGAFEMFKPLLEQSYPSGSVIGIVEQVGPCELRTRNVYARRPELTYGDGDIEVLHLDEIRTIEILERGFRFSGGWSGKATFTFDTEAEAQTYANAFAALAAPCMRPASAS